MGETVSLTAGDGHAFAAYRARPAGETRGGLVVIQEIFGINGHMREIVEDSDAKPSPLRCLTSAPLGQIEVIA